jgi:hypothetical protein
MASTDCGRCAMWISSHPANGWHRDDRPGWFSLRTTEEHARGAWLFVRYRNGELELYDLASDPHLLSNRARDASVRPVRDGLDAELRRRLGGRYRWP